MTAVSVIGLGTMGHGIAQAFAVGGHDVRCFDPSDFARDTALSRIRVNLQHEVEAGLFVADQVDAVLGRIAVCATEADALAATSFVTEAAAEDLELKQELFARVEGLVSNECILASNTSTFPMTDISLRMANPERAINTHWFNPPHIVPLVEVIPGKRTSAETTDTTLSLLDGLGKIAVPLQKEVPGFLINRIQIAMYREVLDLFEQGVASAEDIDRAFRASVGFRSAAVGPLQVFDFAGLDIGSRVYGELVKSVRSDQTVPQVVETLVEQGKFGVKTGAGLFDYTPEVIEQRTADRDRRYLALKKLFYSASE